MGKHRINCFHDGVFLVSGKRDCISKVEPVTPRKGTLKEEDPLRLITAVLSRSKQIEIRGRGGIRTS